MTYPFWPIFEVRPETVGLKVGFITDIHSIKIAKIIKLGIIGVMRGANSIDIVSLHDQDIFNWK